MTRVCRVHTDWMRASWADLDTDEGSRIADAFDEPKLARRELAAAIDFDASLALAPRSDERLCDAGHSLRPTAFEQCEVMLVDLPLPEQRVQGPKRAPPLGDEQASGGRPVEAMHQLERLRLGPQTTQRFDAPERDAAAAVHGQARRLVQHEQAGIFVKDTPLDTISTLCRRFGGHTPA